MPASSAQRQPPPFAAGGSLELAIPSCEKGIGSVIRTPGAQDLIEGVRIEPYALWPDDRGYFLEVMRGGSGLVRNFPAASTQVSVALSYPGTIKAFHYHLHQHDCWVPSQGAFQVVLVDFRRDSRTFGVRNTLYTGVLKPWQILIPPGVGHGYKVVGTEPGVLVYVTDRFYNPEDEGRIPYDHPDIDYDWDTQHK
jgi:dTDP-4-dehydrorhamnose 3,5-epimerase